MSRILFRSGCVLTMSPRREIIEDGAVLVEDGRIAVVGRADRLPAGGADQIVDARGRVVMPGLVNAHTHLCMIFGRTMGAERPLLDWLKVQMPIMARLDEEAAYLAILLGCAENLKNGNTTVVENIFLPRRDDFAPEDAAFRAMRDSGIRGIVARAFHARNFAAEFVETAAQQERRVAALAERWQGAEGGRLGLSIGPLLPWIVTIDDLRATRRLADRLGLGIHLHVAESPEFNRKIAEHFGRQVRNVELLHEAGCLGPDVQAVAVADVSEAEVELLARTRTAVVFDPQTRLFWGTGFPAIKPFLDAGIVAGLGSNGPAANCGQDLFESMKYACATAKTAAGDPAALGCRRALEMATIEGARALGLDGEIGSLEAGKRADVITVDLAQAHLTPAVDVPAALVYAARGGDVRDVMVDGRMVVRDGRLVETDEAALIERCGAAAARCIRAAGHDPGRLAPPKEGRHVA